MAKTKANKKSSVSVKSISASGSVKRLMIESLENVINYCDALV